MSILVAEDDPTIRNNLKRILELEGHAVRVAGNGREALALVREQTPTLVISDVMMPEMDGHALLRELRGDAATAHVPFVFLTARAARSDTREGMLLGADDYLTKPFDRGELVALVQTQLARNSQRLEELARLREETSQLRDHDPLTHLPNRGNFERRVATAIEAAGRAGESIAAISLYLEGIGSLRQTDGSRIADAVLQASAERLSQAAMAAAVGDTRLTIARVGDARFALLMAPAPEPRRIESLVRDVLSAFCVPVVLGEQQIYVLPAAGIAVFPTDGTDAETLMRLAEAAEPAATPCGSLAFHDHSNQAQANRRARLLQGLHGALDAGQFSLQYQPKVASEGHEVVGFEALLRWHSPEFGPVPPVEFIPLAEDSGLINSIGSWVLLQAARQMRQWMDAGMSGMKMAVNLSPRQFEDDRLPALVAEILGKTGLPPEALELEVTESIAMRNTEHTLGLLHALKHRGVSLALDDFGTGFSSLAYLKRYPIDTLKIDKAFVRHMQGNTSDQAICRTIIMLAHNFGLNVVAEGVETQTHATLLADMGCDIFQGWHFGRAMPPQEAVDWLRGFRSARNGSTTPR